MNIKNLKIFKNPNTRARLCAISLVGVITLTSLTGCGKQNEDRKIILSFGNQTYSLEMEKYVLVDDGFIKITLADGTQIITNEMNVLIYDDNSSIIENIEQNVIEIERTGLNLTEDAKNKDTVLMIIDNEIYSLEIEKYVLISDDWIKVILADGTEIKTNTKNLIAYNSSSKMMDQVEEHAKVKKIY